MAGINSAVWFTVENQLRQLNTLLSPASATPAYLVEVSMASNILGQYLVGRREKTAQFLE
jgi:hypothetical protein